MKTLRGFTGVAFFVCTALLGPLSCSNSTDDGNNTNTNPTTETNGLSASYPSDLAVTSPFTSGEVVEGLVRLNSRAQATPNPDEEFKGYFERIDELETRITATDPTACGFGIGVFRPIPAATCYGPSISYTNHPDWAPPDDPSLLDDNLPPGDLGIWDELEANTNEPCVVAKVNSLMAEVQSKVDMAVDLVSSMLCVAKVTGADTLPVEGESKDLTTTLQDGLTATDTPFTISAATIERQADTSDGFKSFLSEVSGSAEAPTFDQATQTIVTSVHLKHIPTSDDNSTYRGRLWMTVSGGTFGPGAKCGGQSAKMVATSILYSKDANGRLLYRLQRASYCSDTANPFDANNALDASKKDPDPDGWVDNFVDSTFDISVSDSTGVISYAWQAGTGDSHARVFLSELSAASDGGRTGCGYFGFGPDVTRADIGSIDGMICNWAGPHNDHTPQALVQRQCVDFDTTNKIWTSNQSNLAVEYGPVNACAVDVADAADFDGRTVLANQLAPIAEMNADVTPPAKPSSL
ncbi:MAG TPA: hypothetical protein VI895_04440 [Bdellovibrionota bacterium]|nr:hypothetical protein [Bdellovibrionota bacterium]